MSHVKISLPGPTADNGRVEIDGEDISAALRGFTLSAQVGGENSCTLQLAMRGIEVDGIQQLYLSWAQVGLLARFGWRPPEGAQIGPDGSVRLERLADPNDPRGEAP